MFLSELQLLYFKNYEEIAIKLSPKINCLLGENGSGKTNFLDAIHYLCMTKSAFNSVDTQNIKHQEAFFMINGIFHKKETQLRLNCSLKKGEKKSFKVAKKEYEKLSEHIGLFPCVLLNPYDTDLIREGSEERRKFFDNLISQTNKDYLQNLIQYNQVLKQRNALLKDFVLNNYLDKTLLEHFDKNVISLSEKIYLERKKIIAIFEDSFQKYYTILTQEKEKVSLSYRSQRENETFVNDFSEALSKDLALQRTTLGTHKDDYIFKISHHKLKKFGSQGQQKSYVISLKLAQYDIIKQLTQLKPILLLDDIFDKLDDERIMQLLTIFQSDDFGQIFITDARPERTKTLLGKVDLEAKILKYIAD